MWKSALNQKLESDSVKNDKSKESDLETTKQICVNRKPALSKECLYTEDLSKVTLRSKDSLEELNRSKSNNQKQRPKKDSDSIKRFNEKIEWKHRNKQKTQIQSQAILKIVLTFQVL